MEQKQDTKYYTPSIEEFHVGFEYEAKDPLTKFWVEFIFEKDKHWWIEANEVRVKHLDQEDIESLGWQSDGTDYPVIFNEDIFYRLIFYNNNKYEIRCSHPSYQFGGFLGTIKNKSELKKIMKQLGI